MEEGEENELFGDVEEYERMGVYEEAAHDCWVETVRDDLGAEEGG